jgi:hypothetical protein
MVPLSVFSFQTGFIVYTVYLLSLILSVGSDSFVGHSQNSFIPADLFPPVVAFDNHRSHFQTGISPYLPILECLVVPPRSQPRLRGVGSSTTTRSEHLDHISRPRNAFMIFRSEFIVTEKLNRTR